MKKIFYTLTLLTLTFVANAQTTIDENFNYGANDSLVAVANGWISISGGNTNAIRANATGLVYAGYAGSGIGTAAAMTTSGQDVVKDAPASITSGSIYCSYLMNVSAAQATGDYFFSIVAPASTSAFFARTFIKSASTGYYKIGITKAAISGTPPLETVTYQADSLLLNTTYLVVVKYQYNVGSTTNDSAKIFVFSSGVPTTEPSMGTAATIGGTNTDATGLQRVLLRQGAAGNAPTLVIDGIRFGTSWADAALPVVWKSFTATKGTDANILRWSTASETNNSHFEIQRSVDGKNFDAIGKVKGAGNSSKVVSYSFNDAKAPAAKTTYYRLKQVDFDGKAEYSKTVSIISVEKKTGLGASLPNPFNAELNVTINAAAASVATVELMDMIGKTHYTSTEQLVEGANKVTVETNDMPNGIYFIRVTANGETFTQKVIKK